jgi:hypothetical protein
LTVQYVTNSKKYQCLSTDTKPLDLVVGDEMFETDTAITYKFDGKDWAIWSRIQPENAEGGKSKVITSDWDAQALLIEILTELKKIEYHLSIATDTNL